MSSFIKHYTPASQPTISGLEIGICVASVSVGCKQTMKVFLSRQFGHVFVFICVYVCVSLFVLLRTVCSITCAILRTYYLVCSFVYHAYIHNTCSSSWWLALCGCDFPLILSTMLERKLLPWQMTLWSLVPVVSRIKVKHFCPLLQSSPPSPFWQCFWSDLKCVEMLLFWWEKS